MLGIQGNGNYHRVTSNIRFGRLVTIKRLSIRDSGHIVWKCICDCGVETNVRSSRLVSRATTSCGCFRREDTIKRFTTHGMTKTVEYNTWVSIRARCTNPNNPAYSNYGGRGIYVDESWNSFIVFYEDMGPRPEGNFSIERIDNDGPYSKDNCKWIEVVLQPRNTRNNLLVSYKGITKPLICWAEDIGINYGTLYSRIMDYHWTVKEALTTPTK